MSGIRWTWATCAVLLGVACFELLLALDAVSIGDEPGAGAPGADAAAVVAVLATLVGAVLGARRPAVLLAPAAALALLAHWYGYDPYYAPSRRRYSDGGMLAPGWVYGLVAAAVLIAVLTVRRRRQAGPLTSAFLAVALVSFAVVGAGH